MEKEATRTIEVRQKVLAANEEAARELRSRFELQGTAVVNLISSPGSGKTSLLEATLPRLRAYTLGVLEGDIATDRDAERIRRLGVRAHQILTGGACHLDARQVDRELTTSGMEGLDFLFIENVGNLICPTSYDLGEDFKVVLLSVTEGDDKPFKYPGIYSRSRASIISKCDLLPYVDFDLTAVESQIRVLNPSVRLFRTSARTGEGISEWCGFLTDWLETKRTGRRI
jgi:hydrogenase nickel incorporation protein HypB